MKLKPCNRCGGFVVVDRIYSNFGHIELSCLICGNHWEYHRTHPTAIAINRMERRRERGLNGLSS
jgi:hypothetical protein